MKDNLEKEENLNHWIDLIFGINKEYNENSERYYNSKCSVELKSRPDLTNDDLTLQSCDFGVLPLKLFSTEFPKQNEIKPDLENKIIKFNYVQFKKDHIHCLSDERISFICIGEKGINSNYLDLINDFKILGFSINLNFFKRNSNNEKNIYYLFTGDTLGSLSIYKMQKIDEPINLMEANKEFIETNPEKNYCYNIENHNYLLLNKFNDHSKEITYIDYNPRLNLLADYSLDGFINIYSMPSLKLIRAIQTKDYNIKGEIKKIALVSTPFPMICISSDLQVFVLDINGEFIKNFDVNKGNIIEFCVDKNCGRVNDYIVFIDNKKMELRDIL